MAERPTVEQRDLFGAPRTRVERVGPWMLRFAGGWLPMSPDEARQNLMLGRITVASYIEQTRWCALVHVGGPHG